MNLVKLNKEISFKEVERRWSTTYQSASCVMQDWDRWVYWTRLELLIFKCYAEVLAVDRKREGPFVHVEENAKNTLSLEDSTVALPLRIRVVPQLSNPKERPSEFVVTECCALITLLWLTDAYFEFVFRSSVCHNLPVVDALRKCDIAKECSEEIVFFFKVYAATVRTHAQHWRGESLGVDLPLEGRYQDSDYFTLQPQLLHPLFELWIVSHVSIRGFVGSWHVCDRPEIFIKHFLTVPHRKDRLLVITTSLSIVRFLLLFKLSSSLPYLFLFLLLKEIVEEMESLIEVDLWSIFTCPVLLIAFLFL